jgi:hypothetical protein
VRVWLRVSMLLLFVSKYARGMLIQDTYSLCCQNQIRERKMSHRQQHLQSHRLFQKAMALSLHSVCLGCYRTRMVLTTRLR